MIEPIMPTDIGIKPIWTQTQQPRIIGNVEKEDYNIQTPKI